MRLEESWAGAVWDLECQVRPSGLYSLQPFSTKVLQEN